jgi:hypothetical protein
MLLDEADHSRRQLDWNNLGSSKTSLTPGPRGLSENTGTSDFFGGGMKRFSNRAKEEHRLKLERVKEMNDMATKAVQNRLGKKDVLTIHDLAKVVLKYVDEHDLMNDLIKNVKPKEVKDLQFCMSLGSGTYDQAVVDYAVHDKLNIPVLTGATSNVVVAFNKPWNTLQEEPTTATDKMEYELAKLRLANKRDAVSQKNVNSGLSWVMQGRAQQAESLQKKIEYEREENKRDVIPYNDVYTNFHRLRTSRSDRDPVRQKEYEDREAEKEENRERREREREYREFRKSQRKGGRGRKSRGHSHSSWHSDSGSDEDERFYRKEKKPSKETIVHDVLKACPDFKYWDLIPPGATVAFSEDYMEHLIGTEICESVSDSHMKPLWYNDNGDIKTLELEPIVHYKVKLRSKTPLWVVKSRSHEGTVFVTKDSKLDGANETLLCWMFKTRMEKDIFEKLYKGLTNSVKNAKAEVRRTIFNQNYSHYVAVCKKYKADSNVEELGPCLRSLLDGKCPHPGPRGLREGLITYHGFSSPAYTNTEYRPINTVIQHLPSGGGGGEGFSTENSSAEQSVDADNDVDEPTQVPTPAPTQEPKVEPVEVEVGIKPDATKQESTFVKNSGPIAKLVEGFEIAMPGVIEALAMIPKFGNNGGLNYTGGIQRPEPEEFVRAYIQQSNGFNSGTREAEVDDAFLDHDFGYWKAALTSNNAQDYTNNLNEADYALMQRLGENPGSMSVPFARLATYAFQGLTKARAISQPSYQPIWFGEIMTGRGWVPIPDMTAAQFNSKFGGNLTELGMLSEHFDRGHKFSHTLKGGQDRVRMFVGGKVQRVNRSVWTLHKMHGFTHSGRLIRDFDVALSIGQTLKGFVGLKGGSDNADSTKEESYMSYKRGLANIFKVYTKGGFDPEDVNSSIMEVARKVLTFKPDQDMELAPKGRYVLGSLADNAIVREGDVSNRNTSATTSLSSIAALIGYVGYRVRNSDETSSTIKVRYFNRSVSAYYVDEFNNIISDVGADTKMNFGPIAYNRYWYFTPSCQYMPESWGVQMTVNPVLKNYLSSVDPTMTANIVWSDVGRVEMSFQPWFTLSLIDNVPRIVNWLVSSGGIAGTKKVSWFALAVSVWLKAMELHSVEQWGYNGKWTVNHNCNVNQFTENAGVIALGAPTFPYDQEFNKSSPPVVGNVVVISDVDFTDQILTNYDSWSGWAILRPRYSQTANFHSPQQPGYADVAPDNQQVIDLWYEILSVISHPIATNTTAANVNTYTIYNYSFFCCLELAKNVLIVLPGIRSAGNNCGYSTPTNINLVWANNGDINPNANSGTNVNALRTWAPGFAASRLKYDGYIQWAARRYRYMITPEEWSAAYTWVASMRHGTARPRWSSSATAPTYWNGSANPVATPQPRWADGVKIGDLKSTVMPMFDVRTVWMWNSGMLIPMRNETTEKIATLGIVPRETVALDMQRLATGIVHAFDTAANLNGIGIGENISKVDDESWPMRSHWFGKDSDYEDVQSAGSMASFVIGGLGLDVMYMWTTSLADNPYLDSGPAYDNMYTLGTVTCAAHMLERTDPIELGSLDVILPGSAKFRMQDLYMVDQRNWMPKWTRGGLDGINDRRAPISFFGSTTIWGWTGVGPVEWDDWMVALFRSITQAGAQSLQTFVSSLDGFTTNSYNMWAQHGLQKYDISAGGQDWLPDFYNEMTQMVADRYRIRRGFHKAYDAYTCMAVMIAAAAKSVLINNTAPTLELSLTFNYNPRMDPKAISVRRGQNMFGKRRMTRKMLTMTDDKQKQEGGENLLPVKGGNDMIEGNTGEPDTQQTGANN